MGAGASGSSSSNPCIILDDDDEEVSPLSDEKYAEKLQLQEALMFSSLSLATDSSTSKSNNTMKHPLVILDDESSYRPPLEIMCDICCDSKTKFEMFRNINVCSHVYCAECIRRHIAEKIKLNITKVTCPDPACKGVIGPEVCRSIVPREVLERWENALCESLILGSQKFYCPFKDCSAMLVNDGGVDVTSSECPYCNRLFCAQCKVAWHSGLNCEEFKRVMKGEIDRDDIMLMNLAKDKKWQNCPSCKFLVEKKSGCDHISCRCGYYFCYGCGQQHTGKHVYNCKKKQFAYVDLIYKSSTCSSNLSLHPTKLSFRLLSYHFVFITVLVLLGIYLLEPSKAHVLMFSVLLSFSC